MLNTIKEYIKSIPDKTFDTLYQEYVISVQDNIVKHQIEVDSHKFTTIDDINAVMKDLNALTEELKK